MTDTHGRLLSPQQAAERLGCSRTHTYDLAHLLCRHNVSAKPGSTKTRFCEAGIEAYIASTAIPSHAA
jgi:predicted DNA-binding transcriptional regulator AlpA